MKYLDNRKKDSETGLAQIEKFQETWHKLGDQNEVLLLQSMNQTYQEAEAALAEPKPLKLNNVFSKVSKDIEYAHISRYILSAANQL